MITNVMGNCIEVGVGQSSAPIGAIRSLLVVFKALRSPPPNKMNRGGKNNVTLSMTRYSTHTLEGSLIAKTKKKVAATEIDLCCVRYILSGWKTSIWMELTDR